MAKNAAFLPHYAETVGRLKASGAVVNVLCQCGFFRAADLDAIIAKFGPDFDLSDRRPPCPDCGGRALFHYGPSKGTPTRPLRRRT